MASGTFSQLDELLRCYKDAGNDFGRLMMLIGRFGIDYGPNPPDCVARAKEVIEKHTDSRRRSMDDKQNALDLRSRALKRKLRELRVNQERCGDYFDGTLRELPNLSTFMTCQLYRICPDFKEQLKARAEKLKNGKIRILVTGEICAGKSSVSSLLMGGAYLPVDHGRCTKIPCEITHSEDRKAFLYYKEDYGLDPAMLELSYDENHGSWIHVRECIELGTEKQTGKHLDKVVLKWPVVMLASQQTMVFQPFKHEDKGDTNDTESKVCHSDDATMIYSRRSPFGTTTHQVEVGDLSDVTFIDVPGIYDTEESFHNLYPYIRSADAFLVVINNADGPGTARDRLLRLLEIIQEFSEEDHCTFNPRFCMFVCNKWDRVEPPERRDRLLSDILGDLRTVWPRIDKRQLVPCVASRQVLNEVKSRYIGDEFEQFYHKICGFLETAIRTQIEINSWWLTSFLDRSIVIIRHVDEVTNFAKRKTKEVKEQVVKIKEDILVFEEKRREVEQQILHQTEVVKQKVKLEIGATLKKNRAALAKWRDSECPHVQDGGTWDKLHQEISTLIAERLEHHIMEDENVQAVRKEFDDFIRTHLIALIREYEDLEKRMPLIVDITNGMATRFEGVNNAIKERRDLFPYVAAGLAVIFLPLAPFILILWRIYDEINNPRLLCSEADFSKDRTAYMKKQTENFIDNIVKSRLVTVTEAAVQDAPRNAKFMIAFLHNCTEKHLESANALIAEITSKGHGGDSPKDMETRSEELKLFVINNILEDDIDENHLNVDPSDTMTRIGGNQLTTVHKGKLITDDHVVDVAVKVIKWPKGEGRGPDNAFIIRELLTIQMLSHKPRRERCHFIEYHGYLMSSTVHEFKLYLVTDLYDYNLQNLIETERLVLPSPVDRPRTVPFPAGDRDKGPGWGYILDIALQAAKGLQFLHRYNVVHRDVKPSNFLIRLTADDIQVHLADVGMSHKINLVNTRGPHVGTDLYNAPEVRHGGIHSPASDIYSLGLVIWELWHGQTVYSWLSNAELHTRERPPPKFTGAMSPPSTLKKLIQRGWDEVPARRPNIGAFMQGLKEACAEYMFVRQQED